jgi:hypothetical protein
VKTIGLSVRVLVTLSILGCAKSDAASASASADSASGRSDVHPVVNTVRVAKQPPNACGWIPQQEVEAILGTLAEPPKMVEGSCRYTLAIPATVAARRDEQLRLIEKVSGGQKLPNKRFDPYAVDLTVSVSGDVTSERALSVAHSTLKKWRGDSSGNDNPGPESRQNTAGWDKKSTYGYGGRIGHVQVMVTVVSSDLQLPRERLDTLAAHVRNHIADLPFPMPADYYSEVENRDPCVLLTRQEAEAVLGPLVVPPYRSANEGPLAYPNGTSCSYFTAGHHVLVITPKWWAGKSAIAATHGIGSIMGHAIDNSHEESADTLEGPWDEAAMDLDGRLALLKGDRLLEIEYITSSTDEAGALKLARPALERLASAR